MQVYYSFCLPRYSKFTVLNTRLYNVIVCLVSSQFRSIIRSRFKSYIRRKLPSIFQCSGGRDAERRITPHLKEHIYDVGPVGPLSTAMLVKYSRSISDQSIVWLGLTCFKLPHPVSLSLLLFHFDYRQLRSISRYRALNNSNDGR